MANEIPPDDMDLAAYLEDLKRSCAEHDVTMVAGELQGLDKIAHVELEPNEFLDAVESDAPETLFYTADASGLEFETLDAYLEKQGLLVDGDLPEPLRSEHLRLRNRVAEIFEPVKGRSGELVALEASYAKDGLLRFFCHEVEWHQQLREKLNQIIDSTISSALDPHLHRHLPDGGDDGTRH